MLEKKEVIPTTDMNSFAIYWLRQSKFKLYYNNREILNRHTHPNIKYHQTYSKLKPVVHISEKNEEEIKVEEIKKEELWDYGYGIVGVKVYDKFRMRQRKNYIIIPLNQTKKGGLNKCPEEHTIEMDVTNKRFRLRGPNAGKHGVGNWTGKKLKKGKIVEVVIKNIEEGKV